MYIIIWKYKIKVEHKEDFFSYYNSTGKWFDLFRNHKDFINIDFARSEDEEDTYITIDRWTNKESCVNFIAANSAAYKAIDSECENFTYREELIGKFIVPD
jgi:hypothetical protein